MLGYLRQNVTHALSFIIGAIFIWAGLSKLHTPYEFLGAVYAYEMVGPEFGWWIASLLPWLEVAVGVSLTFGVWKPGGSLLAVILAGMFTVALFSAAGAGLKIPCGCGAASAVPEYTSYWKVAQSAVLLAASGWVFFSTIHWPASPGESATTTHP